MDSGPLAPTAAGRLEAARRQDAVLWCALSAVVLCLLPVGFLSGDGVAQSVAYARGTWFWNPNHLLLEPLGAWWQGTLTQLGFPRSGPDQLKLLSIVSGAAAAGLFRWGVAGGVVESRGGANHGTAWFVLSATFLRLWISDETHMIQMPFLVLAAIGILRYVQLADWRSAIATGMVMGLAALTFVSNGLLVVTSLAALAVRHAVRAERHRTARVAAGLGGGALVVAGGGFLLAWVSVAPAGSGFLDWLTAYGGGGGNVSNRVAGAYGTELSLTGLAVATARAIYGAGSVLVDLEPLVETIRDRQAAGLGTALTFAAFAMAGSGLAIAFRRLWRRRREPGTAAVLWLAAIWVLAIVPFGIFWNSADDQFYFQLAVPLGALVARGRLASTLQDAALIAASLGALGWNVGDAVFRHVLYPRTERVTLLAAAVSGAGLVVSPGHDEIDRLFYFIPDSLFGDRMTITGLSAVHPPGSGMVELARAVRGTLAQGRRVAVISVFDIPPGQQPWKYLRTVGYERAQVLAVLAEVGIEPVSRRLGPFTIRTIVPAAGGTP